MKKFICLVVCMLLLSGCAVKGEFDMGINSDKSINFSVTAAFDDELLEALMSMEDNSEGSTYTDDEKWEYLESSTTSEDGHTPEELGFTATRYEQDGFKGITYTKTISNIDSITGESASFDIIQDYVEISSSKLFIKDGDNYVSKIIYSPVTEDSSYTIDQEMIFALTLPNKPVSHNADSISDDGKTLTWDLSDATTAGNIEFTFSFSSFPIVLVVIGVIALIGVIAAVLIFLDKGKKKNNPVNPTPVNNTINPEPSNLNQETTVSNNTQVETFSQPVNMDMNIANNNVEEPKANTNEEVKMFSIDTNETPKTTTETPVDNNQTKSEEVKIFSFDTLSSNQPTENTTNKNSNLQ